MSEDRCISCGEIVPEGRMVCPICLAKLNDAPTTLRTMTPEEESVGKWARKDLVKVVRCRECRWYSKEQGVCFHPHSNRLYVSEDFYCAEGKRREKTDDPR